MSQHEDLRTPTQRTLDLIREEWTRPYREAIREHREAIEDAGTIQVDPRDERAVRMKYDADRRLWRLAEEA